MGQGLLGISPEFGPLVPTQCDLVQVFFLKYVLQLQSLGVSQEGTVACVDYSMPTKVSNIPPAKRKG